MTVVTTTVEIARPPEAVFDAMTDTDVWLAISPELVAVEPRGRITQGATGTMTRKQGRKTVTGTWEIVELTPGQGMAMRGRDPGSEMSERVALEPLGDGRTRMTSTAEFRATSGAMRVLLPLMTPWIRRSFRRNYVALKAHVEAQAPQA
ncbi:MAG: SRPBCC family protein [Gaiellales bacterium]